MSIQTVNQFLQEAAQDPGLQQQLQSATDRPSFVNKVVELGNQKGYSITASDVEGSLDSLGGQLNSQAGADGELSEDELEAVAGGFCTPLIGIVTGIVSRATVSEATRQLTNRL